MLRRKELASIVFQGQQVVAFTKWCWYSLAYQTVTTLGMFTSAQEKAKEVKNMKENKAQKLNKKEKKGQYVLDKEQ